MSPLKSALLTLLSVAFVGIAVSACDATYPPEERNAKYAVRSYLKNRPDGSSYKKQAWGLPQTDDPYAGTGTENLIFGKSEKLSRYSIAHKFRMLNGFGMHMSYNMRFFFSDETFSKVIGFEYMSNNDPTLMY